MAAAAVLGADVIAHAEYEPPTKNNPNPTQAAARVLAHRYPGVPNLGDVSQVDWPTLGPVDIVTGGFPCQDVSLAGRRLGIAHNTRSGLWGHMATAVDELRPGLVIIENVRGLLSADAAHPAHDLLESCAWCVGDGDARPLRALGAVLGDLADLGYDAAWRTVSAADVGAPHGRARVFITAWPTADAENDRRASFVTGGHAAERPWIPGAAAAAENTDGATGGERWFAAPGQADGGRARTDAGRPGRAPAADTDGDGLTRVGRVHPVECDPDRRDGPHRHGHAAELPAAADADGHALREQSVAVAGGGRAPIAGQPGADTVTADRWGPYGAAVRRWATVLGRDAPPPTEPGRTAERLSPRFVEWMMGLPAGWVCDVPGITRNEQLRILGNGVVPQQAAAAIAGLLRAVNDAAPPSVSDEGAA